MWFIAPIIAWLTKGATAAAAALTLKAVVFLGLKGLAIFMLFTAVPIMLYNVLSSVITDIMTSMLDYISTLEGVDPGNLIISLSGMGGYIATQIMLPQCFSVFMTFLSLRWVLNIVTLRM